MQTDYFIKAEDFEFAPYFHRNGEGDSGTLLLATSKVDEKEQYIVKSETPELACNEFMYNKIASAMGLYTPEVKLLAGLDGKQYAAGIRYISNAQEFGLPAGCVSREFTAFQMLYYILCEEDSIEIFIDGQGRLFKIDNAASFNLNYFSASLLLKDVTHRFNSVISSVLDHAGRSQFKDVLDYFMKRDGEAAYSIGVEMLHQFASIDELQFDDVYVALDEMYSGAFSKFYRDFIHIRKRHCETFLKENNL